MGWWTRVWSALACALLAVPAWAQERGGPDFANLQASADARYVAQWVMETVDHRGMPFAVVDKREARLYVFDAAGRLVGAASALLGQTVGDDSAPDVGAHTQAGQVPAHERTTPAGRFVSQPGRNLTGEHVVWVDYATALAIHRLRADKNLFAREARLASASADDKRASLGCVVVPAAFYDNVVHPVMGRSRAVVYVLPETRPVRHLFGDA